MNVVNKERKVLYGAANFSVGVSDFVVTVRKPNGDILSPAPTMSEVGEGVYTFSYTPDVVGMWQEKIVSSNNGDKVVRGFDIVALDLSDVDTKLGLIEGKVDTTASDIDSVITKVDAVKAQTNTTEAKVDGIVADVDSVKNTVETTDSTVTAIAVDVDAVKGTVEATDTKIDTATGKIDAIKAVVDSINLDVGIGGYFIN
jgi:peptidoglycan hydrolase CwlO-like protein